MIMRTRCIKRNVDTRDTLLCENCIICITMILASILVTTSSNVYPHYLLINPSLNISLPRGVACANEACAATCLIACILLQRKIMARPPAPAPSIIYKCISLFPLLYIYMYHKSHTEINEHLHCGKPRMLCELLCTN